MKTILLAVALFFAGSSTYAQCSGGSCLAPQVYRNVVPRVQYRYVPRTYAPRFVPVPVAPRRYFYSVPQGTCANGRCPRWQRDYRLYNKRRVSHSLFLEERQCLLACLQSWFPLSLSCPSPTRIGDRPALNSGTPTTAMECTLWQMEWGIFTTRRVTFQISIDTVLWIIFSRDDTALTDTVGMPFLVLIWFHNGFSFRNPPEAGWEMIGDTSWGWIRLTPIFFMDI